MSASELSASTPVQWRGCSCVCGALSNEQSSHLLLCISHRHTQHTIVPMKTIKIPFTALVAAGICETDIAQHRLYKRYIRETFCMVRYLYRSLIICFL